MGILMFLVCLCTLWSMAKDLKELLKDLIE